MAEIFIRFLIGLVGIGIGIALGYLASAHLLARTYDAEKELKRVKDERDYFAYLLTQVSPMLPKTQFWGDTPTELESDDDYFTRF